MNLKSEDILKNFTGNENATATLLDSIKKSNNTGVWLLRGPKGIGKSKIAFNIIKGMLNIEKDNQLLIHPDLFVLKKDDDKKKFIPVEEVRKVSTFLSKTAIKSSFKAVFIDAINELNHFGHNALLKSLEEYSFNTSFIIIDHMNTVIPSTIKSRCKKIIFKKLTYEQIKYLLEKTSISSENFESYSILSNGSIGEALKLHDNNALEIHKLLCSFFLEIYNLNNNVDNIQKLFQNKKNNNNIFTITFLMIFRFLRNALKKLHNVKVFYIDNLEEEVVKKLSESLNHAQINYLINILYERKKNMINFNLDIYSSLYLTLNDIEKAIKVNEK